MEVDGLASLCIKIQESLNPDHSDVLELIELCKGAANHNKIYVLSKLEVKILQLISTTTDPSNNNLRISLAQLLRVLTYSKESKISESSCLLLVKTLKVVNLHPLTITLCACIWNLSVIESHRFFFSKNGIIAILAKN
eukprot:TRINITY_DN31588_c0_g1_i1.p1 TRINITY_DN31588_c0_g1~~TRINITY_DN31588_c0_g1_i1.p1  ORF type:complete len:138 (-),score=27.56 TRINITY_DN31588_c0_g1_i1:382-795(-)